MVKKIDHIAIAVKNLEETLRLYDNLFGLKADKIEVVPDQKVKIAIIKLEGIEIEILEPLNEESPVAKFIEKRGEGLHHIAFEVEDVEQELKGVSEKGADLIDKQARKGLAGNKVGFLRPKSTKGVLIELVQKPGARDGKQEN